MKKLDFKIYSADHDHQESIPDDIKWTFQGIYLHGKLEYAINYDLTFITEESEYKFYNGEIKPDIYKVDVVDSYKNITYNDCIFYFWDCDHKGQHWYRGLICLPDDIKANNSAKDAFNNKAQFL